MNYYNRTDEEKGRFSKNPGVRQDDFIVLVLQSQLKPNLFKLSTVVVFRSDSPGKAAQWMGRSIRES
jgi:hypothetical protein